MVDRSKVVNSKADLMVLQFIYVRAFIWCSVGIR